MSNSNISGAKQRQINATVTSIVTAKLATLDAVSGDRLIAKLTAFGDTLAPAICAAINQFSDAPPVVLKLVNSSVKFDAIVSYDPKGFKTRKGLWVSDEFHARVGSKAKQVQNLSAITLTSGDLVKNAYDREIKADPVMPANHVFETESDFVAYLDQMIGKQPNGEEGDLNNQGYWNIFYVADCVVIVRWYSDRREWNVRAWRLGGSDWRAGGRVFARN